MIDRAWVALSLVRHLGSRTLNALLLRFSTPQEILAAAPSDLMQVEGVGSVIAQSIASISLEALDDAIARWQAAGVSIIPRDHPQYPLPLSLLDDAPPTVFMRGAASQDCWTNAVAVVGTRHPTPNAQRYAATFAERYAGAGYTIVSGLAQGIDAAAHQAALRAGAPTAAVLGSGVLNIYPQQHQRLAARIVEAGGTLLCECPPDAPVNAPRLVARNRLITGLARLLLLVETAADGGAMHAVRFARQQKRVIYVLDLPASGNQQVIREGADRVLKV